MPEPRTGSATMSIAEEASTDHVIRQEYAKGCPPRRVTAAVTRKVATPSSDDRPIMCRASIARLVEEEEEKTASESGG